MITPLKHAPSAAVLFRDGRTAAAGKQAEKPRDNGRRGRRLVVASEEVAQLLPSRGNG